jgi:26S proteasome regulatory subunit N1
MMEIYESWKESETRKFLADILSVLAMSYADEGARNSVKYRLLGTQEEAGLWGHEYVRHLSSELIGEFNHLTDLDQGTDHVVKQALELVPFFLKHNAEADACDLLLELELLDKLPSFIDKDTYKRVCLYIIGYININ